MDNKAFFGSVPSIPIIDTSEEIRRSDTRRKSGIRVHITADDLFSESTEKSEDTGRCKKILARFHPQKLLPVLEWLPSYHIPDLKNDLVAAITVAIMHVPQGLAYGELAGVAPIQGLYVSTFPPLMFALLGTGKHVSIGTFAVVALLVRSAIPDIKEHIIIHNGTETEIANIYTTDQIVTTLATSVGVFQVLMGVFSLGSLSVLLSEPMLSGFTTGAAMHVIASQLKGLFDIRVARRKGMFKVILTFYDVIVRMGETNWMTTAMSISAMILVYEGQMLNDRFKHKLFMPVPVELIVVIIVTCISYGIDMHENYGSDIMGVVPTGLPPVTLPQVAIAPSLVKQAIVIGFISYVICLSLGKTFGRRNGYKVDANQELIAMGGANIFGSFLDCFPCAASLSRSSLQEKVGCKTQLTSIMSSGFLLIVIMFAGPLFFYLPKCVLSSIIIVALKGMLLQVKDCIRYAKVSLIEAVVWLCTFFACCILDIEYGIAAGALCTVAALLYRDSQPRIRLVTPTRCAGSFLETLSWDGGRPIFVVRVESEVNFINRDALKDHLLNQIAPSEDSPKGVIVLDLSTCPFVDCSGCTTIREILDHYNRLGFHVCVVGAQEIVTESLMISGNNNITFSPTLRNIAFELHADVHHF